MWKSLFKAVTPLYKPENCILLAENVLQHQLRTTFIVKRKVAPFLAKKGLPPKKLRSRHHVYELVKDTSTEKQPNLDVILTSFVDGLGNVGDRVSVKPNYAYNNLLLPGLAVYATPDNLKKYENVQVKDVKHYSSPRALMMMETLSRVNLSVVMNKESPWSIQPWHIKVSFRKCGYVVPEHAITLPEQPIKGPNMDIEGKVFYITVTINNTEKAKVKCRVHHWSTEIAERLPHITEFWKQQNELIFPEQGHSNEQPTS